MDKKFYKVRIAVDHVTDKNVLASTEEEAKTIAASSVNQEMKDFQIPGYKYFGITLIVPEEQE